MLKDCIKTLESTKIMHRESGGSYVYKNLLDCCVVGSINGINKGITTSCNRVAVRDVVQTCITSLCNE